MARNYYVALGISRWASERKIKAAFRDRIRLMHGVEAQEEQLSPEEAEASRATLEQHLKEIEEAYDVLSDARKRKQYDDFLQRMQPPSPAERRTEISRARRARYVVWCVISGIIFVASLYFGPPSNFPDRLFYRLCLPACLMILFGFIVGPPYPEVYGWEFWDYFGLLFLALLVGLISWIL
jgi:curved DNA-binding protein CbpA